MQTTLICIVSLLLISTATSTASSWTASGYLPPNAGYDFQYYQVYVPENATQVSVAITNTSPDSIESCYNVYEYLKVGGQPCSDALYNGASNLCLQRVDLAPSLYGGNHTTTISFDAGDEWYQFAVGQSLYIGVGTELKYDSNCTFSIAATVQTCNSTDEVGLFDYYGDPGPSVECVKYDTITKNGDSFILSGNSPSNSVYYVNLPENISWVEARLEATTDGRYPANTAFSITGRNYGASNSDIAFNCSTHSYVMDNGTSTYRYAIRCDTPAAGSWYWTIRNGDAVYDAAFNATVVFTWQQCNDTAGWDCAYPLSSLNILSSENFEVFLESSSQPLNQSADFFGTQCTYAYYSFETQSQMNQNVNISCWSNQTLGWLFVRHNGFPSSYVYDLAVNCTANGYAAWIPQDFYPGGVWYLAVCNPSNQNQTFYLSASSTNTSSSTSSSGTTSSGATTSVPSTLFVTTGPIDLTTDSTTGVVTTTSDSTTAGFSSSYGTQLKVASSLVIMMLATILTF